MTFTFKRACLLVLALILTSSASLGAEETDKTDADFNLPVVEKVLKNGLTVLIVERPGVPVVSFSMMQPVGAQDAPKGKTGLPHMLEHMMFKGTETIGTKSYAKEKPILDQMDKVAQEINDENDKLQPSAERLKALADQMKKLGEEHHQVVVKDELSAIYTLNGGQSLNAWTSQDATNYTVTLPANKINLYAAVEKDRLSHPVFREFYSERNVVAQERRWRTESNPEGKLSEALEFTAFSASPYKDPTIGWMSDIMKLMRPDAENFYHQTYRPDQGVLAVVGGIKAEEILPILEKTLGEVPNPPVAPLKKNWSKEPPQEGQKTVHVYFDADPIVMMGWHMPNFPHPEGLALDVLTNILTSGNTSRLVRRLLYEKKLVTSISTETGFPGDRSPNLFVLSFTPAAKQSVDSVVTAIDLEIADIRKNGVTAEELDRARREIESSYLWGKTSTSELAQDLAYNQAVHGDWRYVTRYLDMVRALTPNDIQKAANQYLISDNRTIAYLERKSK
ncbi:MAG TPA: pitrilysin family protein [bacterium]|jgi:predicted Zn-dependent peptidase|nr:pitrilysin family protein [bacterium]